MTATPPTVSTGMSFTHPTALNLGVQTAEGFHQDLLRGLTHKLNNMLAIIQGFSSLILMSDERDAATRENMQHIKEASMNISTLSERIRQAGGCAKLSLQSLNLNEYLSVVDGALREPFLSNGVPFEVEVAAVEGERQSVKLADRFCAVCVCAAPLSIPAEGFCAALALLVIS